MAVTGAGVGCSSVMVVPAVAAGRRSPPVMVRRRRLVVLVAGVVMWAGSRYGALVVPVAPVVMALMVSLISLVVLVGMAAGVVRAGCCSVLVVMAAPVVWAVRAVRG
jgi:hypothetical protein